MTGTKTTATCFGTTWTNTAEFCEAPIVSYGGEELDGHQPWDGYYTHWSKLPPMPRFPLRSLMIAPPGTLICDEVWDVLEA